MAIFQEAQLKFGGCPLDRYEFLEGFSLEVRGDGVQHFVQIAFQDTIQLI